MNFIRSVRALQHFYSFCATLRELAEPLVAETLKRGRMHHPTNPIPVAQVFESEDSVFQGTKTHARGPEGVLPINAEMLLMQPSGNLFGLTQNAGLGWEPARLLDPEFLILSTHGGMRAQDGTPIALGFHTGHWEVGLLVAEAARELRNLHAVPFAGSCTDPCDGRSKSRLVLTQRPIRISEGILEAMEHCLFPALPVNSRPLRTSRAVFVDPNNEWIGAWTARAPVVDMLNFPFLDWTAYCTWRAVVT